MPAVMHARSMASAGNGGGSVAPTGQDNAEVAEMELKAKKDMQRAAISSAVLVADAAIAAARQEIADAVNLPDGDSAVAMTIGDLGAIKTQLATAKAPRIAAMPASLRPAAIGSALAATLDPPQRPRPARSGSLY